MANDDAPLMMTASPNDVASLMFIGKHRIIANEMSNIIFAKQMHHIAKGDASLNLDPLSLLCYSTFRGEIMTKRKWLINVLIDFAFIILFFIIYQISILMNLDVFGVTETGGGIVPYGARVQGKIFLWAIVSIIIAFILWRIKKLNIKLIPLLLIAIILPIMVYRINHHIFINGIGAEYKEKQTIVIDIKERQKNYKNNHKKDDINHYLEDLKKYPIFVAEQTNEDFYTYLYINDALDDMYLFMKLSPDSVVHGNGHFICHQFMQPLEEYLADNKELNYNECKVVSVNNYGIRDIEIYNNCAILTKEDFSKTYFICDDFKWLLDT